MTQAKTSSKSRTHTIDGRTITSHGFERDVAQDFYHSCLTAAWWKFFGVAALAFVLLNVVFALLYLLDPSGLGGITNLSPQNFWGTFFFSVETLATVGYGDMHPRSMYSHVVATIEVFVGMINVAVLTGLVFARFSKPRSRILFSDKLVVSTLNGQSTLMLRAANARVNLIANATAKMHVLINEVSAEGKTMRRIYDLDLVRSDQPMFALTWTIMHSITPTSPLYGMTVQDMQVKGNSSKGLIFLIRITGFDESIAQEVHMRHVYTHENVVWGHQFVDVVSLAADDGMTHIDYEKFHLTEESTTP